MISLSVMLLHKVIKIAITVIYCDEFRHVLIMELFAHLATSIHEN